MTLFFSYDCFLKARHFFYVCATDFFQIKRDALQAGEKKEKKKSLNFELDLMKSMQFKISDNDHEIINLQSVIYSMLRVSRQR